MESETITNPASSDPIPEIDSTNETHDGDRKTTNKSAPSDMDTTSVNLSSTVENVVDIDVENGTEDAMVRTHLDDTQNETPETENKTSEKSMNDLESTSDSKDNNAETTFQVHKENEDSDEKCLPQVPVEKEKKIDISDKRIAKQFRVTLAKKKFNKLFFGTVEKAVPGKKDMHKVLYDDGDVDVMSRDDILDAIKYYEKNKKYDTNTFHKVKPWPHTQTSIEDAKDGNNRTNITTNTGRKKRSITKASPPKRGKATKTKVPRKEPVPEWTGPPDEHLDGGWPEGVSGHDVYFSALCILFKR